MSTCICTRPTDGFACRECAGEASKHLRTIAELVGLLDEKRARVRGVTYTGSAGKAAESPVPFDPRVSRVEAPIRIALVGTATALAERGHTPPATEHLAPLAAWISELTDDIRMQPEAPEEFATFEVCATNLVTLFDRPPDQLYLGQCQADLDDGGVCSEPVYVEAKRVIRAGREEEEGASSTARCSRCGAQVDVAERRELAREALAEYQATMAEIVALKSLVGVSRSALYRASASGQMPKVGRRMERNIRGEWREVDTFRFADAMALAESRAA